MAIWHLVGIAFFSILLIRATDILLKSVQTIARKIKLSGFVITTLVLGLATSLPELVVGITSALEGVPVISLGNVLGSNIADLSLVVGLTALLGGSIVVRDGSSKSDLLHAFLGGIIPLVLLLDKTLSRVDGLLLILLYGFYHYFILEKRKKSINDGTGVFSGILRRLRGNHVGNDFARLFLGLVVLVLSADMIVKFAKVISFNLNLPVFIVGLFLVAVGTSLPELAFELEAVIKHKSGMFMGNLLGSIVANSTLIIGITALLSPIRISAFSEYSTAVFFYIAIFFLFYIFVQTKHRLERWEGFLLTLSYVVFLIVEMMV